MGGTAVASWLLAAIVTGLVASDACARIHPGVACADSLRSAYGAAGLAVLAAPTAVLLSGLISSRTLDRLFWRGAFVVTSVIWLAFVLSLAFVGGFFYIPSVAVAIAGCLVAWWPSRAGQMRL